MSRTEFPRRFLNELLAAEVSTSSEFIFYSTSLFRNSKTAKSRRSRREMSPRDVDYGVITPRVDYSIAGEQIRVVRDAR